MVERTVVEKTVVERTVVERTSGGKHLSPKAAALRDHFEAKFTSKDVVTLQSFDGPPRPLPIRATEVEKAAKSLKNGRATGPDGIPSELFKYADPIFHERYANCINNSLSTNTVIHALGEGVINPLQKVSKAEGPIENIRPLTLSNCGRKGLSMITLRRIREKVDAYTGSCQSGYKMGRSCSDIVFFSENVAGGCNEKRI